MSTIARGLTLFFALFLLRAAPVPAAQQAPDPCSGRGENPADISLQLSFKSNQPAFHQGELLELVLSFTSTATQKYFFDTRSYDRSGRMTEEVFCLEPAAARDPLDDYFGSGVFGGFMGGGLGGIAPVGTTPAVAEIDLNEWKVLTPGRYRLRLQSRRIERTAARDEPGAGRVPVSLWSNQVEFQVIAATPEWEAGQLRMATAALDAGPDDQVRRGARLLRFLESEAATREMARRFEARSGQSLSDLRFGLIGSPHRQLAIESLRAALIDPSHPVTVDFISTLALLEVTSLPELKLPPYDQANRDAWMALRDRKQAAFQQLANQHVGEAIAALPKKEEAVRALTVNALLTAPPSAGVDRASLRTMLLGSWASLPVRTRNEILAYRWEDLGGPDMLPILRQIVAAPPVPGQPGTQRVERGPALTHLYELAPAEGREWILREMVASNRTVGIGVLTLLPDRELPEIEEPIFARLRTGQGNEIDYQLLERYGTAQSFPEVRRAFLVHRGRWACALQTSALRQLLKTDPAFGAAEVSYALTQRQETGCYTALLKDLKESLTAPGVERIAIAALDDSSPEVVRNAAEALGVYGSPAAEAPLWRRLERFHETFKDRPDDLRTGPGFDDPRAKNSMIEYGLMNALAKGQAWFCTPDKLARLKGLISPLRQTELTRFGSELERAEITMRLTWPSYTRLMFYEIAGYSGDGLDRFIQKMKQFPPGTQIVWPLTAELADRHSAEVEAVRQAAKAAGLVLRIKYP